MTLFRDVQGFYVLHFRDAGESMQQRATGMKEGLNNAEHDRRPSQIRALYAQCFATALNGAMLSGAEVILQCGKTLIAPPNREI